MATTAVRLTQLSHGAGCACKLPAGSLREVLAGLPAFEAADLIVGHTGLDDAAVWRISDELAVVQTIDFFTPLVDDPYTFGRIAATNAFSDIYAMGARPAFALNVVAFPKTLPMQLLGEILRGGADVAAAAGAAIVRAARPHAVTDVTGFGLVGHARELAAGAGLRAEIDWAAVLLLSGVRELIAAGHVPGGTRTNLELAAAYGEFAAGLGEADRLLACDAQTSGGLFVSLPAERAEGLPWPVIGRLVAGEAGTVHVG